MKEEIVGKVSYIVYGRIVFVVMILLVIALVSCGKKESREDVRGDVTVVDLEPGESALYSHEDIYDAMDEVLEHFEEEFPGCVLTNLVYDEEYSLKSATQWAEKYGDDEAIVFLSSFDVGAGGGKDNLKAGDTYRDWQWVLTRDKGDDWDLQTWGQGISAK